MCGIYCSIGLQGFLGPSAPTEQELRRRGPDCYNKHELEATVDGNAVFITCASSVLSLRGHEIASQPLKDPNSSSFLCWNGEAWKIGSHTVEGSDSARIFELFVQTVSRDQHISGCGPVINAISQIAGPYAFVFYDSYHERVYFGRDCLGRRSLMRRSDINGSLIVASVRGRLTEEDVEEWLEVEADGIYYVDLHDAVSKGLSGSSSCIAHVPLVYDGQMSEANPCLIPPYGPMSKTLEPPPALMLGLTSQPLYQLERLLRESIRLRVRDIPPRGLNGGGTSARLGILFSGGLDCTLLARIAHEVLPEAEEVDLLNVAFYNPRINGRADSSSEHDARAYEACPDRITGRKSFHELQSICANRNWRFVEMNVSYRETLAHRDTVKSLMYPHNTEMDLSIAYALYFAARGIGAVKSPIGISVNYETPARVLLSGLGADEIFGGYQRHATAFARHGHSGLLNELELDFNRLGKRNLGRDDRVTSHWGKEVRYPYLDEEFLSWALSVPVGAKCGFMERTPHEQEHDFPALEPGKQILRLLAWKLGMQGVAMEKKRAIQFGARTAKMETGKSKGTQQLS